MGPAIVRFKNFSGFARRSLTSPTSTHRGQHAVALSFSGSGMMMLWQMGVADVMRSDPTFMARVHRVLGTSGGACVGAMLLASRPKAFSAALQYYTSGGMWQSMQLPHDLLHPHDALLRRTVATLGLLPSDDSWQMLRGRFSAHVTPRTWPLRNMGITDFQSNDDVITCISASCCLLPHAPVSFRGQLLIDGGYSNPLPEMHDDGSQSCGRQLPTITVSILAGHGVDMAPGEATGRRGWKEGEQATAAARSARRRVAEWRQSHPFLRYDGSLANAQALVDASALPRARRAQWRFEQGQQDAVRFLRSIGHDPPPPCTPPPLS